MGVKRYDIEIPKMDYQVITLAIRKNGELTKLDESDKMYFSVKRRPSDTEYLFQKTLDDGIYFNPESVKYEIRIDTSDTKDFSMGEIEGIYGYDITIYYQGTKPKQKVIGNLIIGTKYTLNEVV